MIFGEGITKDLYRRALWGPGMMAMQGLPSPWEHRLVRCLGRAASAVAPRKRREVEENLRRAFPSGLVPDGRSVSVVAEDVFASHFANQYVGPSFTACTVESWPQYLAWRGLSHLEAARADGCGVVLAHPHMGPAQLPLHVLGLLGMDVVQIGGGRVTRVTLSDTGEWAKNQRTALERRMPVRIHDGRSYLRPLVRALASGSIVLSAADGTGGGDEIGRRLIRTVLEHQMGIAVGPIWLAARGNARLHTVHCYRNPGDGPLYVAEIGEEIPIDRDQPILDLLEDGADHLAQWLDRVLRNHPGDWLFWDGFAPGALLP
jgi:lauroyl/myristoyl acyltransferase